jgi:hypothetical protein
VECATRSSWSYRLVDRRVAMAVNVAPERGDTVQIAAAVGVDQLCPLGGLDHQRLLFHPATLLRQGMPEVIVIEPGSFMHSPGQHMREAGWTWAGREAQL